jgi:hypothetical protein
MESLDFEEVKRIITKNIEFDNPKQRSNFLTRLKNPNTKTSFTTKLSVALCKNEESIHVIRLLEDIKMLEDQMQDILNDNRETKKKNKRLKNKLTLYIEKYGEI